MVKILLCERLAIGVIATFLEAVGLAIPYWTVINTIFFKAHLGLWEGCFVDNIMNMTNCSSIEEGSKDALNATRALSIIATLVMAVAVILLFLKIFVKKNATWLTVTCAFLFFLGGILAITGVGIYANDIGDSFGPRNNESGLPDGSVNASKIANFFVSEEHASGFPGVGVNANGITNFLESGFYGSGFILCVTASCLAIINGPLTLLVRKIEEAQGHSGI